MTIKQDYDKACKELIESKGNTVGMNSPDCNQWKASHGHCFGCQYEMGCSQFVGLVLASMDINPADKIGKVINTKTPEEVEQIPFDLPWNCHSLELAKRHLLKREVNHRYVD
ncbi:hypothetical protein LCGC14_2786730 [marine sediment metagenome]|uniref:Uncharacterized protein n=1 Tax=marine sediment metagenome TaxID=412755 RepID=A0A0F9BI94_9ZZZZ